ncbi:MAG: PLDc N-terminal domain-containing protein, partial [Lachnospiraceae bacterium]|nr:PLDc N-terminal domain-containing protein [Lachnospiraceae bacterium]
MGDNKKKTYREMHLLASSRRGFWRVIFSRTGIVTLLFLLGVFLIFAWVNDLTARWPQIIGVMAVLQFVVVLVLLNEEMESTAKNTWMLVMYVVPILGPLFFVYSKVDLGSYAVRKRLNRSQASDREILPENTEVLDRLEQDN